MAKDISLEEVDDQARRFPGLDSSLKAAVICHAQASVSVNQSKNTAHGEQRRTFGWIKKTRCFW